MPHENVLTSVHDVDTHLVIAGDGDQTVVVVPGTNFPAAACLPLLTAMAGRCRVVAADVPGQPGLSSVERVAAAGRLEWYSQWLTSLIEHTTTHGPVTVLGHSLGAAIALACDSPLVDHQVLVSPGGLTRLRITPRLLGTSAAWLLRRSFRASARLLHTMHAPGHAARAELVEWMALVARHVRTSADPGGVTIAATGQRS
ncbi:alpha/beta hydrolase [Amycolatopsis suaedae]|uniref:Alpha/beta hydrolase n=1 Tax=Amycolatopsis suaedae TaxID=2510978 RepID=A0A4Q7JAT7_9PSEU|nr:alpha/beta hydrolase [Amycolatopsis suaedae]